MPSAEQVPATDTDSERRSQDPGRRNRMRELVNRERTQCHVEERGHLVAHRLRIESTADGVLHPRIRDENPPGGNRRSQACKPRGGKMETGGDLVPAEEHHGDKGRLHEERQNSLDGKRCAEDVTDKPGIVAPVRSELELEDDTRSDAHGEIDAEQPLPEACRRPPEILPGMIITSLHDAHDDCQSQRQWDE